MDVWSVATEALKIALPSYAAYRFGLRAAFLRRRWEQEDRARDERLRLVHRVQLHLEQIRQEIERNEGFYFNSKTEPQISTEIREGIFSLKDQTLIDAFHAGQHAMRELAWGSDHRSSGQKFMPELQAMLLRLSELEADVRPVGRKGMGGLRRKNSRLDSAWGFFLPPQNCIESRGALLRRGGLRVGLYPTAVQAGGMPTRWLSLGRHGRCGFGEGQMVSRSVPTTGGLLSA